MKCNQCGFEQEASFSFCPQCGAAQEAVAVTPNPIAQKVIAALRDARFLVICILMSAGCLLSLTAGEIPLLNILITVFLWLTYAQARKNVVDVDQLRNVSGTVFAQYVITYVAAGIVLLVGLAASAILNVFADGSLNGLLSDFMDLEDALYMFSGATAMLTGGILMVICVFVAVVLAVVNFFSLRYIHGFAKSVYRSVGAGVSEIKYANAASIWLFIIGACSGVSALSILSGNLITGLSGGVSCAGCILAGLLIRSYILEEK